MLQQLFTPGRSQNSPGMPAHERMSGMLDAPSYNCMSSSDAGADRWSFTPPSRIAVHSQERASPCTGVLTLRASSPKPCGNCINSFGPPEGHWQRWEGTGLSFLGVGHMESRTTDTQAEVCVRERPPKLYLEKYPRQRKRHRKGVCEALLTLLAVISGWPRGTLPGFCLTRCF